MRYKFQEQFAKQLANAWLAGNDEERQEIRRKLRHQKCQAQAGYIAAMIALIIADACGYGLAEKFAEFIHPNNAE